MEYIRCKLTVNEPFEFGLSNNNNNVIYGVVVKTISPTLLIFKSDNLLYYDRQKGYILILRPRYTGSFFTVENDNEITVGGGLYLEEEYDDKDEAFLLIHCKYTLIGSLKKEQKTNY